MPKNKPRKRKTMTPKVESDTSEVVLTGSRVKVEWKGKPPDRTAKPRAIQPRRPAPPMPAGDPVSDADESPPINLGDSQDD